MKSFHLQSRPGTNKVEMYYLFLAGSILSIIFAVYWQSVSLPFIQDDWGLIEFARTNGPLALIRSTIDPSNRDRKSTRLNSSHIPLSRMPSSA